LRSTTSLPNIGGGGGGGPAPSHARVLMLFAKHHLFDGTIEGMGLKGVALLQARTMMALTSENLLSPIPKCSFGSAVMSLKANLSFCKQP